MVAAPIQRLAPLMTHSSPVRVAVVDRPPAMSEPWSGSVMAKAPSAVNRARAGSHLAFCSADPSSRIVPRINSLWMPIRAESDTSARAAST